MQEIMALVRALSLCCVLGVAAPARAQTIKEAPPMADPEADAALQHFRLGVEFY